jgi:hypothetical protein
MRRSTTRRRKTTSLGCASWPKEDLCRTPTLILMISPMMVSLLKCTNLRMLCVVKTSCFVEFFCENKDLNLKLKNSFSEIASLQSMHNDMSAQPYENCNMIMMEYVDLWIMHTQVESQLNGAKLELKALKPHSLLLGACTSCPMLKSYLEACSIEIKEFK